MELNSSSVVSYISHMIYTTSYENIAHNVMLIFQEKQHTPMIFLTLLSCTILSLLLLWNHHKTNQQQMSSKSIVVVPSSTLVTATMEHSRHHHNNRKIPPCFTSDIPKSMSISKKRRQRRKRLQQSLIMNSLSCMDEDDVMDDLNITGSIPSSSSSLHQSMTSALLPFSSISTSMITKLWEDIFLSPESAVPSPFRILKPEEEDELFFNDNNTSTKQSMDNSSSSIPTSLDLSSGNIFTSSRESSTQDDGLICKEDNKRDGTIHFCFLVHGHRGHSRDLSYVQAVMRRLATVSTQASNKLIVHSVRCNEKKTDDGIIAGGTRLLQEMLDVIRSSTNVSNHDYNHSKPLQNITISLWGNSLGGLYSRYALSLLSKYCQVSTDGTTDISNGESNPQYWILDNTFKMYLNVFCTTATPHLGISGHTFVTLPRRAEIGLASAMGETGKDLFRLNSVLYDMAIQSQYVHPLSLFRKRICYANAYGTDFPVPASTAAFLSELSSVPHHFADDDDDSNSDESSLVQIATLYTTPVIPSPFDETRDDDDVSNVLSEPSIMSLEDELARMSISLDGLGWKKVFVDMRKEVPHIAIPKSLLRRRNSGPLSSSISKATSKIQPTSMTASTSTTESERSCNSSDEDDDIVQPRISHPSHKPSSINGKSTIYTKIEPIHRMKKRNKSTKMILSSKDVAKAVSTSALLYTSSTSSDGNINMWTGEASQREEEIDGKINQHNNGDENDTDEETHFAIHWPLGHNMIVAFSRSRWSAYMNKAGRPVVDALAKEIVDDIFQFTIEQQP